MKKRILSLLLAGALCLTMFTGCTVKTSEEEHVCNFGEWKVEEEATCEKEGVEVRKCDCGAKEERPIAKLEHKYTEKITTEATCAAEGVKTFTCKNCDNSYTEKIAMINHSYSSQVTTEAGCETDGVTTLTCADCNNTYTESISSTGHNYSSQVTTEASCQGNGVKTFTCSNCQDSYTESILPTTYSSTELPVIFENSVGEVTIYDKDSNQLGLGTCFVISSDGKLITNYHVIEGAYSATVALAGTTYTVDQVLAYDKTIDIAVLKIDASGLNAVTICDEIHRTGETVYAIGSSKGLTATFSSGMISTAIRELDGVKYVQHDAPISSGNSGGPLINIYGEVIGINRMCVIDGQNLNLAIHPSELTKLDYSNPMTMAEVYEAERTPFDIMADYITQNGYYNSEGYYWMTLGSYTAQGGFTITRQICYYGDFITIDCWRDSSYLAYIVITPDSETDYTWNYKDSNGFQAYGVVSANTYSGTLEYIDHNADTSSQLSSILNIARNLIRILCEYMDEDLACMGLSAEDLGFVNY